MLDANVVSAIKVHLEAAKTAVGDHVAMLEHVGDTPAWQIPTAKLLQAAADAQGAVDLLKTAGVSASGSDTGTAAANACAGLLRLFGNAHQIHRPQAYDQAQRLLDRAIEGLGQL